MFRSILISAVLFCGIGAAAVAATIKDSETLQFEETGTDVKVTFSLLLDDNELDTDLIFTLWESDFFFFDDDEKLGNRVRNFSSTNDDRVMKMNGANMVIDHMVVFSNAANAVTGYGNDFYISIVPSPTTPTPDLSTFDPSALSGFDRNTDYVRLPAAPVTPVPLPSAFMLLGMAVLSLRGLSARR